MKTFTSLLTISTLCAATLSTPVFAETGARVLKINPGMCEGFKGALVQWAQGVQGIGAYAVPVAPASMGLDCENTGPNVQVGQSYGFDAIRPAEVAALEYCNTHKPEDFLPCVVVARTFPGK